MSKKLYVGGLSFQTTADDLREAFAPFGAVTRAVVVADWDTGRLRAFGVVEMSGGDGAVTGLDGAQLRGRTVTVNEARAGENRPRPGGDPRAIVYGRRF